MKIAYFDCFAGASGNMILGSLVDAGLPLERLVQELRRLPVSGWELRAKRVNKCGLAALYVDANVAFEDERAIASSSGGDHHHEGIAHRKLGDVLDILRAGRLPHGVERMATKIYKRLAAAEAVVHGSTADDVVFHEVGQIDAIVDITGAALGLHLLGVEAVYCSALPCGRGRVRSAHGESPSPAPATMEMLRGHPTYAIDLDAEFVTPTGAAILTSVASFEPRPAMTIQSIGYGSGSSDFPFPNVLRVLVGEVVETTVRPSGDDTMIQIETNIDDMNPQLYEHAVEQLFAAGAVDVWTCAASMKKGRPGIVLCALSPPERESAVALAMLAETTTIGVRSWPVKRTTLSRRSAVVATSLGSVRVKITEAPTGMRARPEYEDCRALAHQSGKPLPEVMLLVESDIARWLSEGV